MMRYRALGRDGAPRAPTPELMPAMMVSMLLSLRVWLSRPQAAPRTEQQPRLPKLLEIFRILGRPVTQLFGCQAPLQLHLWSISVANGPNHGLSPNRSRALPTPLERSFKSPGGLGGLLWLALFGKLVDSEAIGRSCHREVFSGSV